LCWLAGIFAVLIVGCSKSPDALLQKAAAAQKAAETARAANDPEAAQRAADKAQSTTDQLAKLVEADKSGRDDLQLKLQQAQAASRSARETAEVAAEEEQRREKLQGLKVTAYKKTRAWILATTLPQMALAAEKAGERGSNGLSLIERPLAEQTWNIACLVGNRSPLPDGSPDWYGAASDLRHWSTNPPIEFRALLGLALVLHGGSDLALAEFESVDSAGLSTTNALQIYHGGRALVYVMQGWDRLAAPEVESF
jgi:hypothetical protein